VKALLGKSRTLVAGLGPAIHTFLNSTGAVAGTRVLRTLTVLGWSGRSAFSQIVSARSENCRASA
jgi:hypothetical protein